uniref:Uncharacterized protein n=1 Tax=Kalanchoe fedtschenkoi TaxID=63787 RepID=A0A7N0V2W8_KALFE
MKGRGTANYLIALALPLFLLILRASSKDFPDDRESKVGSIVFSTLGRPDYNFDIYTLPLSVPQLSQSDELRLTDGKAVNFNGHFFSPDDVLSDPADRRDLHPYPIHLAYVTERGGTFSIYADTIVGPERVQRRLVPNGSGAEVVSMKDRPSVVNSSVIYVSTHEDPGVPRFSWAAVYSTDLATGLTRRLTPVGQTDFSPAVSPSGVWTAVASYGEGRGWEGEVQDLHTDIYVFRTRDGSERVKLAERGGWPSWADDSTLYFHRRNDDGWFSVYKASLPKTRTGSARIVRVTPPGLHAFTPAAVNQTAVAVATSRVDSEFRHIELFDLERNQFAELTQLVSPEAHHLNPFVSPDGKRVGYHRCRGEENQNERSLFMENLDSPSPQISLLRIRGSFPSFSPEGDRVAFVDFPGVYVVNSDGTGLRQVENRTAFSTAWDPVKKGVVYTSVGPTFAPESTKVDVIAISVDSIGNSYTSLTANGENNAFPSPSPDGKRIVFRSSRSGHKNLYIMDSVKGDRGELFRLTEGEWTDTMCNWSPAGDWIVFASDRHNPGSGSFELYLVRPNGTGLKKLLASGSGGRANHPWFSPDGKHVVFTSDYAAVSAEPISNPHHYQPYGDLFRIGVDGSGLVRLTHNSYEDGTPTWAPNYLGSSDVVGTDRLDCQFEDCHWLKDGPKIEMVGLGAVYRYVGATKPQCGLK